MSGHVFVVRGDLRHLACDAWLLPGDALGTVSPGWRSAPRVDEVISDARLRSPFRETAASARCFELLPRAGRLPAVWFGDTGGHAGTEPAWYLEPLVTFIHEATVATERERPLLGIPFVGSGAGGQHHASGTLLTLLLDGARDAAEQAGKDVVFVAHDEQTFAAAQAIRRRRPTTFWPLLDEGLRSAMEPLAGHAREGRLVLFFGAGMSVAAGLLGWRGLLDVLCADAGLDPNDLSAVDALDCARLAEMRLETLRGPGALRAAIADRCTLEPSLHALGHALLANLPVREAATMNYDTLYEEAAAAAGRPVDVLPWNATSGDQWLLKLHGSVDHPEDIVLTRTDYVRYAERRGALRGLVQGLLITRHMLFVGFGLGDPNFHEIVDEVRQALGRPAGSAPFGTAIAIEAPPYLRDLWEGDLEIVPAGSPRDLEVGLDHLLAHATTLNAHLLSDRFAEMLSPAERGLRDALLGFGAALDDPRLRDVDAWPVVSRFLERLGSQIGFSAYEATTTDAP